MNEPPPLDDADLSPPAPGEKITVDDYSRQMALGKKSPGYAELLEGVVVPKARRSLRHEGASRKSRK